MLGKENQKYVRQSYIELKFEGEPYIKAAIERDWAIFYKRRNLIAAAKQHCNESLQQRPEGFQPRIIKTQCQLNYGDVNEAHESAQDCVENFPERLLPQQLRNECIYEENRFEHSLIDCHNTDRTFEPKIKNTLFGTELVRTTVDQTIGLEAGPCLHKLRNDIRQYHAYKQIIHTENWPLWKQRHEAGECDACSIVTQPRQIVNPLQSKRTQRKKSNNLCLYFGADMAKDIEFLQKLRSDKRISLPQTPESARFIFDTIDTELARINLWKDQMWQRKPVYAKKLACSAASAATKLQHQEAGLNRIQYQTRRDAFSQLCHLKRLLHADFEAALKYIDVIRNEFYAIKTCRVFPRKTAFMNDIFIAVGLKYIERFCIIPVGLKTLPAKEQLLTILQVVVDRNPNDESKASNSFGIRSDFIDPDAPDLEYFAYKRRVTDLEEQIQLSRYADERCYLIHELFNLHIDQRKLDEPKHLATTIIEIATKSANRIWLLLGYLASLRADCVTQQFIGLGEKLNRLSIVAQTYGPMVDKYVAVTLMVYDDHMEANVQPEENF